MTLSEDKFLCSYICLALSENIPMKDLDLHDTCHRKLYISEYYLIRHKPNWWDDRVLGQIRKDKRYLISTFSKSLYDILEEELGLGKHSWGGNQLECGYCPKMTQPRPLLFGDQ